MLLLRMKPDDWTSHCDEPDVGIRLSKAFCAHDEERRGRIINLTSIVGLTGNPGQAITPRLKPVCWVSPSRWPRSGLPRITVMQSLPASSTQT